jgi:hypothetical protein
MFCDPKGCGVRARARARARAGQRAKHAETQAWHANPQLQRPRALAERYGVYLQPPTGDAQQRVGPAYFSCCCRPIGSL